MPFMYALCHIVSKNDCSERKTNKNGVKKFFHCLFEKEKKN